MLTLKNVRKIFGSRRVLEKISFSLGEGQKAALVGQNGVGKSTLLQIIAKEVSIDKGDIFIPNRALIGYLPQESAVSSEETLLDYLRRMTGLEELEKGMASLEKKLEDPNALEKFERLQSDYERLGGYDFERKAKSILDGLFLSHVGLDRKVSLLSGGEKRKAALAGVLLRGVDILLLDEPTNNLDLPALLWLEKYLSRSKATCLIASHDRIFLDNVVRKVIEIDWYKRDVTMYTGGWSEFAEMKAHAFRKHKELYRMQEDERHRLRESIDEKKGWVERVKESVAPDHDKLTSNYKKERAIRKFDGSAKALQGREKRLDEVEKPLERELLVIPLDPKTKEDDSIVLKKLTFGYKDGFSGGTIDLKIPLGRRIAILGNNGVGKSTLLKTITGEILPLKGKVFLSESLTFGYLMQEHENISQSLTPRALFKKRLEKYFDQDTLQRSLAQFQFSPGVMDDKIASFSPGERVRLILALLSLLHANVLVLDEPTNHLDLEAIEALEEALETYPGIILLVTHDRRFLERVRLDKNYILEDGKLTEVASYEAYALSVVPKMKRILKRFEEKHGV